MGSWGAARAVLLVGTVLEEPLVTPTHVGVGALQTHIPKAASRLPACAVHAQTMARCAL